ncbi:YybH family protein [Salinispora fenicalii]|uniref:YybH family protein n=1 Tax=Salinispora fenicalii TaxID=1137263 RepID=UPI00047F016A|nr:SgcJ/EcaC family oxidoreductase [Salinispora fenicalii]
MASNEEQIRTLIERWAKAVHHGDLTGVLADHTEDIVMFDVPPPQQGVRGLDAYRETWPPFLRWQAQGASFDIESLEVTAGEDVAFAYALLRCGTERDFADNPDNRLRLTFGLRKQDGRWLIVHEHHSFPLADGSTAANPAPHQDHAATDQERAAAEQGHAATEQHLRQLHQRWFASTAAKDLDGLMAPIAEDVVSYEHDQSLQCIGADAVREVCKAGLDAAGDSSVTWHVPDLKVLVNGDLAVAWGLNHVKVSAGSQSVDTWSRGTRIFQRRDGAWLMTHQHLSYPFDPVTGDAKTDLRP